MLQKNRFIFHSDYYTVHQEALDANRHRSLFDTVQLGELTLPNRLVMAPLIRCRAIKHVPNDLMAQYYAQRAGAGLVITECTMVTAGTSAFGNDPGIFSPEQVVNERGHN